DGMIIGGRRSVVRIIDLLTVGLVEETSSNSSATIRQGQGKLSLALRENQNGSSSSSGSPGAAAFGGGALVLLPALVGRSSPAVSPAAPAPAGRAPNNCMLSPTTRSLLRFCPVCLSSHVSICRRPSIKTGRPFFKYSPAISARRAHRTTSTKVTSSRLSPLSVV